ncbi:BQ5605_C005g03705 [Microbotryum silenes-dioicae]|uniref:BQ5605_C005g03705 protein n=1 Tax=Microbotryum silenes-dioicae TaxID=796604 RepID=A0A2X0MBB9_9BASI|nr:BQ5605_C005g03705 [Microbotryum silenes-dioicae]
MDLWGPAKSNATRAIQDLVAFSCVHGEFVNKQLDGWLASRGVVHELLAPYKHGQMGLQEHSWCSIFDKVRTSLAQSGLPLFLWEEAAHAAVYALNLMATPVLDNSTPDLVLHTSSDPVAEHRCPRGSRLRVWGCRVLVPLLPEQRGHKLAPRSCHCFFVGYSQTSQAWRFYCEESTLRSAQDLGARIEPGASAQGLGARSEPGASAQG